MGEVNVFESIINGLSESLEYAKGQSNKARKISVTVADLPSYRCKEIKQIRETLNLTQKNFAFVLGVSPKTVEAWEAGRNVPQGMAQRFLQMLQFGGKKMLQDLKVIDFAR
ncbi:helix-turn-helix domain-containing protein [Treponema medium]|uniref:helix-turn-helix domain-containing protein n=1 Tax=Treponema medium TaxID=58231 RepID=UPI00197E617E|nr:helix-turn-helix domain-containing protein [Treponema medium]QSH91573.1 helix-turn-helix domain-containing protein [Treponema medium]